MSDRRTITRRRGRITRAVLFGAVLLVGGCATTSEKTVGPPTLQPAPQPLSDTTQVVGDAVVASLAGVAVTVRWMDAAAVGKYYEGRPGLVSPWPKDVWTDAPPTVFWLRIRNQTRDEVQFDPALASLVAQDGKRERPIPYEEFYMRLSGTENSAPRLTSLQATLFSRFVVLRPGGEREGLLLFPTISPEAKHLLLEISSFFVAGRSTAGAFAFQVVRKKP